MTASAWFYEQIMQKDNLNTIRLGGTKMLDGLYLQAKEIEKSQDIPELSDEEIKQGLFEGQFDNQDINDICMFNAAKWYREQIKLK